MQGFFAFVREAFTGVVLVLMVAAGLLTRYWDAPLYEGKGQDTDARFAKAVGLWLLIAAAMAEAAKIAGLAVLR